MARARNIKPGFFKNEALADSSCETRLLFIGLWTLADREGRLEDRPRRIRAELFPFDGFDVDSMLTELQGLGFLTRYEVDGNKYIQITNFVKHQDPHYREKASEIPPLPGSANEIVATGVTRTQRARILERDNYKCQQCGSLEHPCIDHVLPVSRGGDSSDDNLQVLCLPCNTKKGNKIDSTSNQRRVDVESNKVLDVPLIPDSLIPDSLIPDSLIPDSGFIDSGRAASTAKRKKPKQPLPEDFKPEPEHYELAASLSVNLTDEFPNFRDHHVANGSVMASWHAALSKWIRNAAKWGGKAGATKFLTAQQQRDENNRRSTAEFLADKSPFFGTEPESIEGEFTNA